MIFPEVGLGFLPFLGKLFPVWFQVAFGKEGFSFRSSLRRSDIAALRVRPAFHYRFLAFFGQPGVRPTFAASWFCAELKIAMVLSFGYPHWGQDRPDISAAMPVGGST